MFASRRAPRPSPRSDLESALLCQLEISKQEDDDVSSTSSFALVGRQDSGGGDARGMTVLRAPSPRPLGESLMEWRKK